MLNSFTLVISWSSSFLYYVEAIDGQYTEFSKYTNILSSFNFKLKSLIYAFVYTYTYSFIYTYRYNDYFFFFDDEKDLDYCLFYFSPFHSTFHLHHFWQGSALLAG